MFEGDFREMLGLFKEAYRLARQTSPAEAQAVAERYGELNTRKKQQSYLRSIIDKYQENGPDVPKRGA